MILQYLTKAKLDELKRELENGDSIRRYENQDKEWFQNYLKQGNGLIPYGNEIQDFILVQDVNYNVSDFKNIQILHQNLKDLPLSVACDERFWTALSHTTFFEYVWYRQGEEIKKAKDIKVKKVRLKGAYFRKVSGRRGIFVNCLSRLWWTGYLAYDETRDNPYELVEPLMYGDKGHTYASQIVLMSARNFTSNRELFHGIMQAILDYKRAGNELKRQVFEAVLTYFNNISAITILDLLSKEDAYEIAMEQLQEYKKRNPKSEKSAQEEKTGEVEDAETTEEAKGIAAPPETVSPFKLVPAASQSEEITRAAEKPAIYETKKKPLYAGSFEAKKKNRIPKGKVSGSSKGPITRTIVLEKRKKK